MPTDEPTFGGEFPAATREQWLKLVDKVLKGAPFETRLVSRTYDAITIAPLYPRDASAIPIAGREPGKPWQVMARVDHPDPAQANAEALHELENGATGLALNFAGSVGAYGFGIDSGAAALARVLDKVFIDGIALDLDLAWNTSDAPAHIAAISKARGYDPAKLDLRMNFNPIGTLAFTGASLVDWTTLAPRFAEMIGEFVTNGYRGPFALADGRIVHAAGGTEAQELTFALASAVAYLRAFEGGGVKLAVARSMIAFKLAADADQFLTTAKFRALRKLWARVEEACGLDPKPALVSAETAWRVMTRRDPWVNVLRTTVATFAAGVGGADSISVLPLTAAIGLPDRFARRLARNTQLILLEESNVAKVADPAAGSGAIEDLTTALCNTAWTLFQEIERAGGIWEALKSGLVQKKVAAARDERAKSVARGRDALTGTSAFPDLHEQPVGVLDVPRRAPTAHGPAAVSAAPMPSSRLAQPFEALRDSSDRILQKTGARPKIFLVNLGTPSDFTARATFAKNFFEAGGIEAVTNDGFTKVSDAAAALKASGARLACLCSSDAVYSRDAVATATALKAAGATHIYLAGRPGELETVLKAAGVQTFVYAGGDMLTTLTAAYDILDHQGQAQQ
ncbi:MAG: methylmalonyl-CoA mutase family protein [Xanthobacteraceae bacterium]